METFVPGCEGCLEMIEIISELQVVYGDRFDRIRWLRNGDPALRRRTATEYLLGTFQPRIIGVGYDNKRPQEAQIGLHVIQFCI